MESGSGPLRECLGSRPGYARNTRTDRRCFYANITGGSEGKITSRRLLVERDGRLRTELPVAVIADHEFLADRAAAEIECVIGRGQGGEPEAVYRLAHGRKAGKQVFLFCRDDLRDGLALAADHREIVLLHPQHSVEQALSR